MVASDFVTFVNYSLVTNSNMVRKSSGAAILIVRDKVFYVSATTTQLPLRLHQTQLSAYQDRDCEQEHHNLKCWKLELTLV